VARTPPRQRSSHGFCANYCDSVAVSAFAEILSAAVDGHRKKTGFRDMFKVFFVCTFVTFRKKDMQIFNAAKSDIQYIRIRTLLQMFVGNS
jgi:hypothetical protein